MREEALKKELIKLPEISKKSIFVQGGITDDFSP